MEEFYWAGSVYTRTTCMYTFEANCRLMQHPKGQPHPTPSHPPPSKALLVRQTQPPHSPPPGNVLVELQRELQELQEKFYNYVSTHEACCAHCSPQPASPSSSEDDHSDQDHSTSPPPQPFFYVPGPNGTSIPATPPSWLRTVLSSNDTPPEFQGEIHTQGPLSSTPLLQGATAALKLIFEGTPPLYLGVYKDKSIVVAASASQDMVTAMLRFPPDPTTPRLCH
ncbi:hypothetical protein EDC04DRAFT_2605446 [Pisolithus marmoratus]|nr:hypothetical protein EDC04DRAFT_2605446 [Pisolithus marmoratus]